MKVAVYGHSFVRDLADLGTSHIYIKNTGVDFKYFFYPGFSFRNFVLQPQLLDCLIPEDPDIVVVILGGNDLKVDVELCNVKIDCEQFYQLLREKVPRAYIVASQIVTRHCSSVNRHGSRQNSCIRNWL